MNFIGLTKEQVTKFAKDHEIKGAALVITDEENAKRFNVSPEAELTVMHYRNKKVAANHAVAPGKLDKPMIQAIVDSTRLILSAEK